ncbi:hypothetical protein [Anoxybacillus gonensis]|uniref:hypothetical protein n=1 Tax=Anoxybacillus gonensis TaxID=198467 RepID=UPI0002BD8E99|nr:hypothetical protein [Anoxybacillus gonensis]EMI11256.1 hypothetical protein F510_0669 [Anoxybacillus gonensis]
MSNQGNISQQITNIKNQLQNKLRSLAPEKILGILEKFNLMAEIESNEDITKNEQGHFQPPLKKGQVVQVKFVGQGTVLNGKHFAIVWYVQPKEGQVVVLPMTSKKKVNQGIFDLGPIEVLKSPINVVLFQQPQTVPRESIHIWTKRIEKEPGVFENVPIELNEFQMMYMNSLFRYTHMREKDLFFKITFETDKKIPQFIPKELIPHLNRHLKVTIEDEKVKYKLPHEGEFKEFPLVSPNISVKERYRLLAGLFSKDDTTRTAAEQEVHDLISVKDE